MPTVIIPVLESLYCHTGFATLLLWSLLCDRNSELNYTILCRPSSRGLTSYFTSECLEYYIQFRASAITCAFLEQRSQRKTRCLGSFSLLWVDLPFVCKHFSPHNLHVGSLLWGWHTCVSTCPCRCRGLRDERALWGPQSPQGLQVLGDSVPLITRAQGVSPQRYLWEP